MEHHERIAAAASAGLGGAVLAAILLLAAQMAVYPSRLGAAVPPSLLGIALVSVAASYVLGVSSYAYSLYKALNLWNALIDRIVLDLERLAEILRRTGDPGYFSLELGRLTYLASSRRTDPLLWSLASLPPFIGLVSLFIASRIMDSAAALRRELSITAGSILRRIGSQRRLSYEEPPPKPLGAFLAAILGYPASQILLALHARIRLLEQCEGKVMEAVGEEARSMLIGEAEHKSSGEEHMRPRAWLITIGNEILSGHTVNTNAAWLGRRLTMLGYLVERGIVCLDDINHIVEVFREALSHKPRVIISTGGLGPTFDDKTSEALAKALGREWVVNEDALKMVEEKYRAAGLELTEHRLKLAKMPRGARPLPNPVGSAPGILVEEDETIIAALPGVPAEMKGIFEESLEPLLREKGPRITYLEKEIIVRGVPESTAAPIIEKALKTSPRLYIKSHPSGIETTGPILTLQIIATGDTREEAEDIVSRAEKYLRDELGRLGGTFEDSSGSREG